jgi:hypothetical protein
MRHRLQDDDARALCCPEELTAEDLVASICPMAASTPALEVWPPRSVAFGRDACREI